MRSRMSSVLAAIVVISSAEPGCCAGFNRRNRTSDHGRHRTAQPGRLEFVRCFTGATWDHVLVLVAGALLSPGRRTVSAALRVMDLDQSASFAVYHRVLSTARWSARRVAHRLLGLLVVAFVREGPVVIGLDDTIERRWGTKIKVSTGTAPVTATLSKRVVCAGCASCCWHPFPGPAASGRCRS
jgi:DDE superfamily endonuclease